MIQIAWVHGTVVTSRRRGAPRNVDAIVLRKKVGVKRVFCTDKPLAFESCTTSVTAWPVCEFLHRLAGFMSDERDRQRLVFCSTKVGFVRTVFHLTLIGFVRMLGYSGYRRDSVVIDNPVIHQTP